MVGNYKNKKDFYVDFINSWINKTIENSLWEKYCDLHIDEIDQVFENKDLWIDGSLYLKELFMERTDSKLFDVILVISLQYKKHPKYIPMYKEDLQKDLDVSPPSFYLFPKNHILINETLERTSEILNLEKVFNCKVYYKEEFDSGEYSRMLYLI